MEPATGEEKEKRILSVELAFGVILSPRRSQQYRPGGWCMSLRGVSAATLWAAVMPKWCRFKGWVQKGWEIKWETSKNIYFFFFRLWYIIEVKPQTTSSILICSTKDIYRKLCPTQGIYGKGNWGTDMGWQLTNLTQAVTKQGLEPVLLAPVCDVWATKVMCPTICKEEGDFAASLHTL